MKPRQNYKMLILGHKKAIVPRIIVKRDMQGQTRVRHRVQGSVLLRKPYSNNIMTIWIAVARPALVHCKPWCLRGKLKTEQRQLVAAVMVQ